MCHANQQEMLLLGAVGYDAGQSVGDAVAIVVVEIGRGLIKRQHPAAKAERFRQRQANNKSYI